MEVKKRMLFRCLFLLLLLPFIQSNLYLIESARLYGDFTNSPDDIFIWSNWWNGNYQYNKGHYLNDQAGFRRDFVRINNQIDYCLFRKLHSNSVVLGSENCLYQKDYISAYYGRDFVGNAKVLETLIKLKALQDTLAGLGKSIVLVHAPCKAFFYPDNFPHDLKGIKAGPSNYETYTRIADSLKINQIDFNAWFLNMKKNTKELLYSKQGIHWTVYGALLAGDSLTKYIEHIRNVRIPHFTWSKTIKTKKARDTDDDIYKALNLILPVTEEVFTYPEVSHVGDTAKARPKAIYIGDSFISNWIHDGLLTHIHSEWEYWFYFNLVAYQNSGDDPANWNKITEYDWMNKVKNTDCVIIMYTSHNLQQLGNGFIEQTYNYFYPENM